MQKDAFSAEEALASLHRLFDAESWEHMFHVLEQKQAMLMNPHPETILLIASEVLQVCTQDVFPTEWAITHTARLFEHAPDRNHYAQARTS